MELMWIDCLMMAYDVNLKKFNYIAKVEAGWTWIYLSVICDDYKTRIVNLFSKKRACEFSIKSKTINVSYEQLHVLIAEKF